MFTAANVGMGFFAVLYSIRGFQIVATDAVRPPAISITQRSRSDSRYLFDTLDGRVARMTRTATEIGVQFDSLADVLTFGIAPIALMYSWAIAAGIPGRQHRIRLRRFSAVHVSDVRSFPAGEIQPSGHTAACIGRGNAEDR